MTQKDNTEKPHYSDHRERLKKKFKITGKQGLADYEMLELLMTYAIPRKDVKPLAKDLIKRFGSLRKVIDAELADIQELKGMGEHSALLIKLIKDLIVTYLEPDLEEKVILSSPEAVGDFLSKELKIYTDNDLHNYLRAELGNQEREFFMILCLSSSNQLLHKQIMFAGTIDQAQVYPREIIKVALIKNSAAIILVHNHPSGNKNPSNDDLLLTQKLESIAREFNLRIHDHIVVTKDSAFSIKASRLIDL